MASVSGGQKTVCNTREELIHADDEADNSVENDNCENRNQSCYLASMTLSKRRVYGLFLMSMAGFYIVLSNVLVQMIHKYQIEKISTLNILFIRSIIAILLSSIFLIITRTKIIPSRNSSMALFILGLAGVSGILFMYLALTKIPVGDVTVIQFTVPIFTTAMATMFLKQACSIIDVACGVVSFLGLIIMTRPTILFGRADMDSHEISECIIGEGDSDTIEARNDLEYAYGAGYALIGAFLVALFFILNQILGKHGDLILMIFYTGLHGIILPAFINLVTRQPFYFGASWEAWLLLVLIGVLSFVHLMFVAESLQFEEAGPASLIRNADSIYAFVLQYTILGVTPKLLTLVGAIIVFVAITTMGVCRYRRSLCR